MKSTKIFADVVYSTFQGWTRDRCHGLGAALSFYGILTIPSFMILVVILYARVYGVEAVQQSLVPFLEGWLNPKIAEFIRFSVLTISHFDRNHFSLSLASMIGAALGICGFSGQLKDSIQMVWGKRTSDVGFKAFVSDIVWSLLISMILATFTLLALSIRISVRSVFNLGTAFNQDYTRIYDVLLTGVMLGTASAVLFCLIPQERPKWKIILPGALFTGVFFMIGRVSADLYLNRQPEGNISGIAGGALAYLLLSYYFAQIFLIGAELTRVIYLRSIAKIESVQNNQAA